MTLKRGQTNELELWAWHEAAVSGDVRAARKDCTRVMYAVDGKPVARCHLDHAWPSTLEVGALKAGPAEALYETVTLICERLHRLAP
ncbi:phage tail protein [Actinopolymorpha sp. NPDC004070]|uniref:phage tail protein n=1 Tax=Actinopolymorpha sp. NPDC004070 TaxID=3154548 RepID=UPI0033BD085D